MSKIVFISGPCGCGKSTFSDALARHLAFCDNKTVYIIHGDDFHAGFIEPPQERGDFFVNGEASDTVLWEDILKFNWGCILDTADRALSQGMDVIIDYIIEKEFSRIIELAKKHNAEFFYIVLTASAEMLESRIRSRGDIDMMNRSLFLKKELEAMPENQGHIYDNTGKSIDEMVNDINIQDYKFNL